MIRLGQNISCIKLMMQVWYHQIHLRCQILVYAVPHIYTIRYHWTIVHNVQILLYRWWNRLYLLTGCDFVLRNNEFLKCTLWIVWLLIAAHHSIYLRENIIVRCAVAYFVLLVVLIKSLFRSLTVKMRAMLQYDSPLTPKFSWKDPIRLLTLRITPMVLMKICVNNCAVRQHTHNFIIEIQIVKKIK